jgi:hypothetical protein
MHTFSAARNPAKTTPHHSIMKILPSPIMFSSMYLQHMKLHLIMCGQGKHITTQPTIQLGCLLPDLDLPSLTVPLV